MVRLGIVGDIHCGPDAHNLLGSHAPTMLEGFFEAMRRFRPDCIVDLGDRINDVAAGQDRQRSAWVRQQLVGIGTTVFHVLGNHDVVNLTKGELGEVLGKRGPHEVADVAGIRIVVLDSQDPPVDRIGGGVGPDQRRWLEAALGETSLPVLVFCHHPLDEQGVDGHWYFAAHPEHALARDRAAVRTILERSGNVLAVVSGHLHWTRVTTINGIPYMTLGSLVDGGFTRGRPCGTFAAVTVHNNHRGAAIDVDVAGLLPDQFRLTR